MMFCMDATTADELASVRAAIANLEAALATGGDATEKYSIGGRMWSRGEIDRQLAVLYKERASLRKLASRPSGPVISVGSVRRPPGVY